MRFNKFFILSLLASFHFYNASAMEQDDKPEELIWKTPVGQAHCTVEKHPQPLYIKDGLYEAVDQIFGHPQHLFVHSWGFLNNNTERSLFTLLYAQWDQGLALIWSLSKNCGRYANGTDQTADLLEASIKNFVTHLQKKNRVFYAPDYKLSEFLRKELENLQVQELDSVVTASPITGERLLKFYVGGKKGNTFTTNLLDLVHNASVKDEEQEGNYIKSKVKDLDSIVHMGIRFDVHEINDEPRDELYIDLSNNFSTHKKTNYELTSWVPFDVYPSPLPASNPVHRLYNLNFTRWADVSPPEQTASGKGTVVLWSTDVDNRHTHTYVQFHVEPSKGDAELTEILKASHLSSLSSFISEFQKDNVVYFSPSFPESWHSMLGLMKVDPITSIKKEVVTYKTVFSIGNEEVENLSTLPISK
ncbi:MAG: hypothetical protein H0X26_06145 [Alphaproteobacteria bacterium]|nr:hypothetical protein [Alphaproteobacteria bacterium]